MRHYTGAPNRMEVQAVKKLLTGAQTLSGFISVVFLFVATVSVTAQPAPPVDRTNQSRQRQQEMSKREYRLRNLGVEHKVPADEKQKKALMAQLEEDFSRILILHNQFARVLSSDAILDYGFVSEAAAEIKKRSTRLQTALALQPESDKEDSRELRDLDNTDLKPALLTLCKQIKSFVTNPVIETPGTVNAEQLAKARRDLASIVSLSSGIRKHAEQLTRHLPNRN